MIIGIPREVKAEEARVAVTPSGVGALCAHGHTVLVERDGLATVVDNRPTSSRGAAYFVSTPGPPEACQPGQPLTYESVSVYRIGASDVGATFDLGTWKGKGGGRTLVSVRQGKIDGLLSQVSGQATGPMQPEK